MTCYGFLSHMTSFTIEDVCIGVEKLTTYNACDLQGSKIEILKMNGKGNIFLEKETYEFNCACNMSCFTIRGIVCEMFNFSIILFTIYTIASIQVCPHSLQWEMECWGIGEKTHQLCTLPLKKCWSRSITFWYNALHQTTFKIVFHTLPIWFTPYS